MFLLRVKGQPLHQFGRCGFPCDHQVIAVRHPPDCADHLVELQLLIHAVLNHQHITVDKRTDAAHPLQITVALQLTQGIAHHGAANPQRLSQLQLTGQLWCGSVDSIAQLLQQALGGLLAAQLAAKAVFRRFIHWQIPFAPGRYRPDSICHSKALCAPCRLRGRDPPDDGRSRFPPRGE